ncbi:hypothetical protein, conserved [Trypanosoma brucei brucei TREU927]|uniref:Uncharacterized protein n=1 Tax=Trypanosoma brucei brucei (strain 927/4 GUTat10.1) TaxID=185431 RepID=Q57UV9_TRYB2|nr:hypothetical protein, conserved [Trypanosoma brucei brucei TREU927]AAX70604.1 hypothetical protein, conserved [Trypanosoma brucei]AAZ13257.1 hypothetical protein, conserved [Trypanosoma brucei brucei TREU927]
MFQRARFLLLPIDDVLPAGSRWSRVTALPTSHAHPSGASRASRTGPVTANTTSALPPTPYITFIPTLHVASVKFYDAVLDYMRESVEKNSNVVVLLEGICDNKEGRIQQMDEYMQISRSEELRAAMLEKAEKNTLYNDETIRTICDELAVNYDVLSRELETVRLQECYLRPKMAALMGKNLCNEADIDMEEVEALMLEGDNNDHSGSYGACGSGSVVPITSIGSHPAVRRSREMKVARKARATCVDWLKHGVAGEVILPWGIYHVEGIQRNVLSLNAQDEGIVFVESGNDIRHVPFGIHRDLLVL